jgi:hypothetical protein
MRDQQPLPLRVRLEVARKHWRTALRRQRTLYHGPDPGIERGRNPAFDDACRVTEAATRDYNKIIDEMTQAAETDADVAHA